MHSIFIVLLSASLTLILGCEKQSDGESKAPVAASGPKSPAVTPVKKATIKVAKVNSGSQPASRQPATSRPATSQPMGALPPGHPPTGAGPAPAAAAGGSITGTITVSDAMKANVKGGAQLFIIVRRDAGEGKKGMLVAAKKVMVTGPETFPYAYKVSGSDVMMQGTVFAGKMRVEARIDQDGDAISKQPGDVVGAMKAVSSVGASQQDFVLDTSL